MAKPGVKICPLTMSNALVSDCPLRLLLLCCRCCGCGLPAHNPIICASPERHIEHEKKIRQYFEVKKRETIAQQRVFIMHQ